MAVVNVLFSAIPAVALLLNLFLLLICISAKKNRLVYAFMWLVLAFSAWTGGSAAMRMDFYPGYRFWFDVSLVGIFATPFFLYNFVHHYTNQKGRFTLRALGLGWLLMIILFLLDAFLTSPVLTEVNGERTFSYQMSAWVVLPLILALVTVVLCARMIVRGIRHQGLPSNTMRPLYLGMVLMFIGVLAALFPGARSFPVDPLACGINALLLFHSLYRKRLITFKMVTSKGPMYLAAAVLTTTLLAMLYPTLDRAYQQFFPQYRAQQTIVFAVLVSVLTMMAYQLIRVMLNAIFVGAQQARDEELRRFSREINDSLDSQHILQTFSDFVDRNIDCSVAYLCVRDEAGQYTSRVRSKPATSDNINIQGNSPLIDWLTENKSAISMHDFMRTQHYRAMWDAEKDMLRQRDIRLILPVMESGRLIVVVLFADPDERRLACAGDIIFLESAAAVMSIASKNAMLYSAMQDEAHHDGLTGLYNRRYFLERAGSMFKKADKSTFSVCIISLDDFHLYNELYGTHEGDRMLQDFSKILKTIFGSQGEVGRHSGKEFIVAMAFRDATAMADQVDLVRDSLKEYLRKYRDGGQSFLSFSAGICGYPAGGSNLDELVSFASVALYAAKKNGKNRTQIYKEGQGTLELGPQADRFTEQYAPTIYALTAAIDAKDHYTFRHSEIVSTYASKLAAGLGLDPEHVEIIRQAGLLHDIGKIGVPESILGKKGPLNDEENQVMKKHVQGAVAMMRYLPSLDHIIPVAIGHHERWDGKGYPRGLAGEDIPIGARCLCLADSFDAMTSSRAYRPALSMEVALGEIRKNLGTQFDPRIGQLFIEMLEDGRIQMLREPAPQAEAAG